MPHRHAVITGRVLAITALALTAVLAVARAGTAAATTACQPQPLPPDMLNALERDLHLTKEEVQTRLCNETRLAAVEERLRKVLGNRFGGSWLSGKVAETLVVATVDPADLSEIAAAGAQGKVVSRSLAELEAILREVDAALPRGPGMWSVHYIDLENNVIVVLTADPSATEEALRVAGVDLAVVKVVESNEQPQPVSALPDPAVVKVVEHSTERPRVP
ncbi:alpha-lytic protease prodomain-containing protein [Streptosporangium sp. NPDC087985]|uniref:alpha-lytic protease prodomain-containing protein n=1 Tax=Streptosporangium sp. NPDC087985 TaxID=3366196 RepID=UPI0037F62497